MYFEFLPNGKNASSMSIQESRRVEFDICLILGLRSELCDLNAYIGEIIEFYPVSSVLRFIISERLSETYHA